ncbi:MAG: redoxin domain-containing protein [Planctomycetes bacterium]|nr:redoxin domain-containing protein [Planctomycetota bacterium]
MRQFAARHTECAAASLEIVRVFHSPVEALAHYVEAEPRVPFPVLADPTRRVYRAFGVRRGLAALLRPSGWRRAREAARAGLRPRWRDTFAHGISGFPADFLIGADGRIEQARYGANFTDSLTVDEALRWARGDARATRASKP